MSIPHADDDVTLPQSASLLAHFCNHTTASEPRDHDTLLSEKTSDTDAYELLYPCTDNDDESKYGFWGELDGAQGSSGTDSSYDRRSFVRGATTFCCLWCAFSVLISGVLGLYFAVDLAFSHYGLGTGMAEWVMYRHQLPPSTSYGIKFCLKSPNREATRPQAWYYIRADTDDCCVTDTIDFILNPKETWKVRPGASLVLRNEEPYLTRIVQKPLASQEQVQAP